MTLLEAARQALEVQPFAYAYTGIKQNGENHGPHLVWKPEYMDAMSAEMGAVAVPLYTAPPKKEWVGLTEAERVDIIDIEIPAPNDDHWALAQSIEAALKEKNT